MTTTLWFFLTGYLVSQIRGSIALEPRRQQKSGCAGCEPAVTVANGTISACRGSWIGHIRNSSQLCAPGWRVCSWYDENFLKQITWKEALSVDGCYAFNAAQDGHTCQECRDDLEMDDLAGIGHGCPHQLSGQNSCIQGGQISASCCVDSHFKKACVHRPGIATGVLCCKMKEHAPKLLLRPESNIHVVTGVTLTLSCQSSGTPTPEITWYKDDVRLASGWNRITVLDSGTLLVSNAMTHDSGKYICVAANSVGQVEATTRVFVTGHTSGCADYSTEDLHVLANVQACKGSWEGHIKKAQDLCAAGWHVCSIYDMQSIKTITQTDVRKTKGCYALNLASSKDDNDGSCHQCKRHGLGMAAVGQQCPRDDQRSSFSCLKDIITEIRRARHHSSCSHIKGVTSGVLCCRRRAVEMYHSDSPAFNWPAICQPRCNNGGECIGFNNCRCPVGYSDPSCQTPICKPKCPANQECVQSGVCKCKSGYHKKRGQCKKIHKKKRRKCHHLCFNGGRCRNGRCKCPRSHWGKSCRYIAKIFS